MSADRTQTGLPARPEDGEYPHRELTQRIIGAAYEVHGELGPGFLEKVYETALVRELASRGLRARPQTEIAVHYKGQPVGVYYADVLVEDRVICEIKAISDLTAAHEAQLLHYLKATGIKVGLLLNFGSQRVQVKRLVRSK
jgi:GxxExxY protein